MFSPALRLLGLVLFVTAASATTMKMALSDPSKYLFYDTTPYRLGMHAGLALLITYGILIAGKEEVETAGTCSSLDKPAYQLDERNLRLKLNPREYTTHSQSVMFFRSPPLPSSSYRLSVLLIICRS
ncbi:hypothetical protein SprV_0902742000 [Sparganum proliferum]